MFILVTITVIAGLAIFAIRFNHAGPSASAALWLLVVVLLPWVLLLLLEDL